MAEDNELTEWMEAEDDNLTEIRHRLNGFKREAEGEDYRPFLTNEELVIDMLDDIVGVYAGLKQQDFEEPANMFEGGEYEA
jgi:hypothetical protein